MTNKEYPIICGKVQRIARQVEMPNQEFLTQIVYLPGLDEVTPVDVMSQLLPSIPAPEGHVPLENRLKSAVIPMRLDAAVVLGSDFKTSVRKLN